MQFSRKKNSRLPAKVLCFAAVLCLGSGCALSPKLEAVKACNYGALHQSKSDISVVVTSGHNSPLAVKDETFKTALEESLVESGLFAKIGIDKPARYRLESFIATVSQLALGFNMTVIMDVNYSIFDTAENKKIWERGIKSRHTAFVSDAFVGMTRLRLATEGATRKSIEELLQEVSKLKLE